jgi:hypothetical protein
LITTAAWILAGIALWFTRSVLDMFGDARHSTRVAMLPSMPELAGLIVLALVMAAGIAALARRWTGTASELASARRQIAAPLFGLVMLALPYLPWLPDGILPLRALAGPIAIVVWFVVIGQMILVSLGVRAALGRGARSPHAARLRGTVAIFLVTLAMSGTAGWRLRDSLTYPSGDEPHYMIMMQSLWNDHDLNIANNYERKDYREYFHAPLESPVPTLGRNGEAYPIHPIGLAVIGAPVLAWLGYHGIVWMLVLLTALTATLMWRWALNFTGSAEAATVAWASIFLGAPWLFTSIAVYPDIPAALCVMVAAAWRTTPGTRSDPVSEYVIRGLAVSVLPWLSMTYAPMAAVLAVVLSLRAGANRRAAVVLLSLFTVSLGCWLGFFYTVWGQPSPMAPFGSQPQIGNALTGVLGLLFDQEFGVFAYAPVLALGLVGIWRMAVGRDAVTRRQGRELAMLFASLLVSVGALETWWGGAAPPGRPLVPALPLLGLPIAWAYWRAGESPVQRGGYQFLVFVGLAVSSVMLLAQDGALIAQDRDGSSRLLQWFTELWPAWNVAPSIATVGLRASVPLIALWVATAAAISWLSGRASLRSAGTGALVGTGLVAAGLLSVAIIGPAIAQRPFQWALEPESRSRVPILDEFDAIARPHAVIYSPFTFTHAANIPSLMTLAAFPGQRPAGQPLPVLLNARYALPAGTYEVEIGDAPTGQPLHGYLGLQVGRMGSPMREWKVTLAPGSVWQSRFTLPVDAEFVGFVAAPPLDAARSLRIRPLQIVDKSRRQAIFHGGTLGRVLSALELPAASLFFHDEEVYPEPAGVWIRGESTATMTVAPAQPERGITLRVHSGARPNTMTFSTSTWGERVQLAPGTPREVHIPPPPTPRPFVLHVRVEGGFVPADVIPGSADQRVLGGWMEPAP